MFVFSGAESTGGSGRAEGVRRVGEEDDKALYDKLQVKGRQVLQTNKKYTDELQLVQNEGIVKGSKWSGIVHSNDTLELLRMLLGMPQHFRPKKFFKLKWLDCMLGVYGGVSQCLLSACMRRLTSC
jgi:hypothetical protein